MEQKVSEENIENYLVFCIDPRKAFAIKSISRSFFLNQSHQNKIRLFLFSLNSDLGFFYKTMTKLTVYVNNFAGKSGFRLQFLRQSAFYTQPLLNDLSNNSTIRRRYV